MPLAALHVLTASWLPLGAKMKIVHDALKVDVHCRFSRWPATASNNNKPILLGVLSAIVADPESVVLPVYATSAAVCVPKGTKRSAPLVVLPVGVARARWPEVAASGTLTEREF